tara:strand:+ start:429 stop:716 length:288 start_codon:yes stop_codon:yes gene_type:complete
MKNITRNNKNSQIDEKKYIKILCNEKSDIVLKTEFGTGRYKFVEFKELQGNVMLEFKLLKDSKYNDTKNIYEHIGECCFLSIEQYLYCYSYCGNA